MRFSGETGLTERVPMAGRAEALATAADSISALHDQAVFAEDLRATIGTCCIEPGVANGIPSQVQLTFEIRAPRDTVRESFAARTRAELATLATRQNVGAEMTRSYQQLAVPYTSDLIARLSDAAKAETGVYALALPSGATHDATLVDPSDIGLLFVLCRGGVSHRPEEFASAEDMAVAIDILAPALHSFRA